MRRHRRHAPEPYVALPLGSSLIALADLAQNCKLKTLWCSPVGRVQLLCLLAQGKQVQFLETLKLWNVFLSKQDVS